MKPKGKADILGPFEAIELFVLVWTLVALGIKLVVSARVVVAVAVTEVDEAFEVIEALSS